MPITRRQFIATATAAAALATTPTHASPLNLPIGVQTYAVRKAINTDFTGTMKSLAAQGFTDIELCSPFGYRDFSTLKQYTPQQLRSMLADYGLRCISCHFGTFELYNHAEERIAWAHDLGLKQMATASLAGKPPDLTDEVKKAADQFNTFAAKAHEAGISAVLHNEAFETASIDGRRVYDMLLDQLDPSSVKFQFQISTMQQGFDPLDYFKRHPGRFISMHCQDWVIDPATGKPKQVAMGQGIVNWKQVFLAARSGGVRNYFVELEDDPSLMAPSAAYLKRLKV